VCNAKSAPQRDQTRKNLLIIIMIETTDETGYMISLNLDLNDVVAVMPTDDAKSGVLGYNQSKILIKNGKTISHLVVNLSVKTLSAILCNEQKSRDEKLLESIGIGKGV
jgi:hypothetical protein